MSRRWLLSLACLSGLFLSLVQLTGARGELRVDETATKVLLAKEPAEVLLAIENATGENLNARVEVELIDPNNQSKSKATQLHTIGTGSKTLKLPLTISFSDLNEREQKELLFDRLRYRVSSADSNLTLTEGLISLSRISSDLFEIRVSTSEIAREGGRYRARVHASHPTTQRPAANVRVEGELKLEDDENKTVKLRASKITDSNGSALLEFVLPSRFPQFPHTLQSAGGEINVTARRGGVVSFASDSVPVDRFARVLISTDKPLYQPGQVMHIRALLFTPGRHALANHNILIRVSDPQEINVYRTVVRSSRFGVATTDWSIPENTRLGNYRIWVGFEGEDDSSQTSYDILISRYELPNFSVNVQTDQKFYMPGQNAEVKVRADYLFGKPVKQGRVRVVRETEREWNYRDQKWEIEEGDKHEGETDANGLFVANINLADDHEDLAGESTTRFKDVTYAAYFTDPTTNRTEQRHFDLRVTKEAIHVYVLERDGYNHDLPLNFHVSTFYADGSPASCEVRAKLVDSDDDADTLSRDLATFRTNRYGLAKVSGASWPREFRDKEYVDLVVAAVDSQHRSGSRQENLDIDDDPRVLVETDKTLYRDGEPVKALITSTIPDQTLNIDVLRDASVIRSERVKLRDGRISFTFPYKSDFKSQLLIAAYPDFPESEDLVGTQTVLYPENSELKVNLRASRKSYRPGEDAQLDLSVRAPEGSVAESVLGIVVLDKAVDERFRTDQGFGPRRQEALQNYLGADAQVAGVSLRDLLQLDRSKSVTPELDLVADLLLNVNRRFYPSFSGGDDYEHDQAKIFKPALQMQLKPLTESLSNRYLQKEEYPENNEHLRRLLLESQIDFDSLRDPWGSPYRAVFSVDQKAEVLDLVSMGADERFDTADDFSVLQFKWPYFRSIGQIIDGAVFRYHGLTGGFIRDFSTLRHEVAKDNLNLDQLRDRWGRAYRFEFEVKDSNHVIRVTSGGPDKQFSVNDKRLETDNFMIWMSSIDYFAEQRERVNAALTRYFESARRFPQTDTELRVALGDSGQLLDGARDPWGRAYYRTFKTQSFYGDRLQMETRATFGDAASRRTEITPVTRVAAYLSLRSNGPDGTAGTFDDFAVATFSSVLSDQQREYSEPIDVTVGAIVSKTNGGIQGVVTDPQGAVVMGTDVVLTRVADEMRYRTTTNDEGTYSFGNLQPGLYELRFKAHGFKTYVVTSVWARAANLTEVDVTLEVGAVSEAVMITDGAAAVIDQTSASVAQTVVVASGRFFSLTTKSGSQSSTPRLREYFPETLLWQPSLETDKRGRARINFKLADNITTWKVAVVASTEDGRIGLSETEINAFQPFFVEHEPPRVLTEGDEISLPVVVRNYLEQKQNVDLEIKSENWFALLGPQRKITAVDAGEAARETFDFRAISSIKDGKQRITAIANGADDAIEKPVTVHPDGEEVSLTTGDIFGASSTLEIDLPENIVPNSGRAELKIYPSLMTHVLESVEAIMSRPHGCGEQTISSTYPSLLLLRHYKQSGEAFALHARAENYLKSGYNRLLNYRAENGGFSYWTQESPDIALTAYALRFLIEASDLVAVDENVIKQARAWLIAQQLSDGRWSLNRDSKSLEDQHRSAVLTAYVSRILAMTEKRLGRSSTEASADVRASQKLALDYLDQWASKIDEPYLLAVYALAAIDSQEAQRARPAIEKLRSLARAEGNTTHWLLNTDTPFHGGGIAGQVETTALVIQALIKYCESTGARCASQLEMVSRGLLFLIKQKDRYGVWYSTQATINVLDAMLSAFSSSTITQRSEATAEIVVNGGQVNTIQIPAANRLTDPITFDLTQFLKVGKNRVEVRRPGGLPPATVQVVTNFYVPWSVAAATNHAQKRATDLRLVARFDKTDARINDTITCYVEAERVGAGDGMMLAEIGLPPGADVDRSSLEAAMKGFGWAIKQYDVLPDRVVLYLWPQTGGVKFDFKFRPRFGLNAKSAPSVIYDYYNPEARATVAPVTFRVK